MRSYLVLREKVQRFNADADIQAMLREPEVCDDGLSVLTSTYSAGNASALKDRSFDLGAKDQPTRAAKLWNDTTTVEECALLTEMLSGTQRALELTGNTFLAGYTAQSMLQRSQIANTLPRGTFLSWRMPAGEWIICVK